MLSTSDGRGRTVRVVRADIDTPAAITWMEGWPDPKNPERLRGSEYTQIVPIKGTRLPPFHEDNPQTFEVISCWAVKRVSHSDQLPIELPDAKKPIAGSCRITEPLKKAVLSLADTADFTLNPKEGVIVFLGERLKIAPHEGSAYLATNKRMAVIIHKASFKYRVALANGAQYAGDCTHTTVS